MSNTLQVNMSIQVNVRVEDLFMTLGNDPGEESNLRGAFRIARILPVLIGAAILPLAQHYGRKAFERVSQGAGHADISASPSLNQRSPD